MRITYFSCSAKFGGVEKIISETINELCKTDEILLIVPKNCEFKDKISKAVKIHEYRSFDKRYNIFLYLEIAKILRKFKPEILHTHAAKATQVGFVLSKFLKFHIVATKHNDRKGKIFNRTKNVIAVSKAVAKTINHKSEIIYFGIKAKNLTPKMPEIFTISAVGRLDAIKGFDALINAVSTLNFNFKLQIIGDGDEKENLQNLINSLNLQNRVFLLGFKENVAEILANSHLQVISSKKEGLGIVLIEGIFLL